MNTCLICNKEFKSTLALAGHKRIHGPSAGTISQTMCSCIITKKEMPVQYLKKYQKNLKPCKHCGKLFKPYSQRLYFCDHSCSASFNNRQRGRRTTKTKEHISVGLFAYHKSKPILSSKKEIVGPYSKLYTCSCKHCRLKFVSRVKRQYCYAHKDLYSLGSKAGYKFTFNVYHYPDLFDIELLTRRGWFSPGGRAGKWNIDGLSRDHRVSVTEAIANNYDPYYITHPLNCELMPHSENNKKKTQSSITYEELKQLVNDYDKTK